MKSQFMAHDVEVVEQNLIYQGHLKLFKYLLRFRLFQGGWSHLVVRELLQAHHAVGVLLFDPLRDEIVLIEQFRLGALDNNPSNNSLITHSPWLLELAAGVIEVGESIENTAKRESFEEAGCEVIDLIPIYEYFTSPGISNAKFSLFCGRINQPHKGGLFGLPHEHEDVRTHVFPKQWVYDFLKTGQINNAAAIIAVQWLQLNESYVKKLWQCQSQ